MGLQIRKARATKVRVITTLIAVFALVAQPLAGFVGQKTANALAQSSNNFETSVGDWQGGATRVSSGTDGVAASGGSYMARVSEGAFTRWGGYENAFPAGGYTTSVDVYLDMDLADGHVDKRYDFSSAINNTAGAHNRDFVFSFGTNPQSSGKWGVSVGNNTPGWPMNPSRNPATITQTGWYTLRSNFHDNGAGILEVTMSVVRTSDGVTVGSWNLSTPADVIGTTVGGHRYGWFVNAPTDLLIDNANLALNVIPDTNAPAVPTLYRPASGSVIRPSDATLRWNSVVDPEGHGPVTYRYESSYSDQTHNPNNSFVSPIYGANDKVSTGTATQIDATASASAVYYWHVRACDSLGNCSDWSQPWKVAIDGIKPTVADFRIDNQASIYSKQIKVSAIGQPNDSFGFNGVKFLLSSPENRGNGVFVCSGNPPYTDTQNGVVSAGRYTATFNTSGLTGKYCVGAIAEDTALNHSVIVGRQLVDIDNTAPSVPSISMFDANNQPVANGMLNTKYFTFKLDNPNSEGAVRYQLKYSNAFNGVTWNPTDLHSTGHSSVLGTYEDNFTQGEGTHYFSFSACDAAGNCSAYSTPFTATYDKTAPTLQNLVVTGNDSHTRTFSGDSEPSATVKITLNGFAYTTTADVNGHWEKAVNVEALQFGISYPYAVTAKDSLGNESSAYTGNVTVSNPGLFRGGPSRRQLTDPNLGRPSIPNTDQGLGANANQNDRVAVLGAESQKDAEKDVLGTTATPAVIAPSSEGWKLFGVAWYWWLLVLAVVASLAWWLVGMARRRAEENA